MVVEEVVGAEVEAVVGVAEVARAMDLVQAVAEEVVLGLVTRVVEVEVVAVVVEEEKKVWGMALALVPAGQRTANHQGCFSKQQQLALQRQCFPREPGLPKQDQMMDKDWHWD